MVQYDRIKDIAKYKIIDKLIFVVGIMYICSELIKGALRFILPAFSLREFFLSTGYDCIMIFLIGFIYAVSYASKRKKARVWPLYMIALGAIFWSLLFHPEYSEWFNHQSYSLNKYFWHVTSPMWGLLILSLFTDKEKMATLIVFSGRLNLIWRLYEYKEYLQRGYWSAYMGDGTLARLDYGLNYGYQVVILVILFLGLFVYNKKPIDLVFLMVALALVIVCGSRGPLICIAIASLMLFLSKWRKKEATRFRFFSILLLLIIGLVVFVVSVPILVNAVMTLLGRSGLQGRAIEMLLNGTITDDSGRSRINEMAYDMIRNGGLFGYGFYGDRYVIGQTWYYGYPHNVFLELLIQFGILGGSIIIIILVYHLIRMMIRCNDVTWQFLLIIMFSASVKLWLSDSFWYYWPFWGLIAILALWNAEQRKADGRKRLFAIKK